jgi:hypothetical protein
LTSFSGSEESKLTEIALKTTFQFSSLINWFKKEILYSLQISKALLSEYKKNFSENEQSFLMCPRVLGDSVGVGRRRIPL